MFQRNRTQLKQIRSQRFHLPRPHHRHFQLFNHRSHRRRSLSMLVAQQQQLHQQRRRHLVQFLQLKALLVNQFLVQMHFRRPHHRCQHLVVSKRPLLLVVALLLLSVHQHPTLRYALNFNGLHRFFTNAFNFCSFFVRFFKKAPAQTTPSPAPGVFQFGASNTSEKPKVGGFNFSLNAAPTFNFSEQNTQQVISSPQYECTDILI